MGLSAEEGAYLRGKGLICGGRGLRGPSVD